MLVLDAADINEHAGAVALFRGRGDGRISAEHPPAHVHEVGDSSTSLDMARLRDCVPRGGELL